MPLCRAQALNLLRLAVIAAALGVASCSSSVSFLAEVTQPGASCMTFDYVETAIRLF